MENSFERLIASYIENKVGISEHFISDALAAHLKQNLRTLNAEKLLCTAGTGNGDKLLHNTTIRSDAIYWLDKKHNNSHENEFFHRIEDFIRYFNDSCYTGITDYEFHYTLYEPGAFYVRHLDRFKNNPGREFSMISYLNENWKESDGGELLIHQEGHDEKITPIQGKTVFFKSDELEHQVLPTQADRLSVTGWLKRG